MPGGVEKSNCTRKAYGLVSTVAGGELDGEG